MLYKVLHWINEVYAISVFFLYIGLFVTTLVMFLFPPVAILILIFSILALVPFVMLGRLIKYATERLAPEGLNDVALKAEAH